MRKFVKRFKILLRVALGLDVFVRPDITLPTTRFGSEYGGWDIIENDLSGRSVVYSFGVGEDATFDSGVIDAFGLTVHAFDPTPRSIEWVRKQAFPEQFVMHEYGIAAFDGDVTFNPPENPLHVSHTILERPETASDAITVPVRKLSSIMDDLGHSHIDILKLDIEGAEYDVIDDILSSEIRPSQFLVEFHTRFPGGGKPKTKRAIDSLRSAGYRLFHVSQSNEEFCFVYSTGS